MYAFFMWQLSKQVNTTGYKNKYTTRNIYQWNCRTHTKIKILFTLISNVSRFWRRYLDLWFSHSQRISQSRSLWPCQILCLLKSFLQSKYLMSTKCRPGVFFPAGHLPKRTTAWKKNKIKTHYRKRMYDTGLNFCLKCHSILAHCSGKKKWPHIYFPHRLHVFVVYTLNRSKMSPFVN